MSFNEKQNSVAYLEYKVDMANSGIDKPSDEIVVWDYRRHRVLWRHDVPAKHFVSLNWSSDGNWLLGKVRPENDARGQLMVFDSIGKLRMERSTSGSTRRWFPDSRALLIVENVGISKQRLIKVPVGETN